MPHPNQRQGKNSVIYNSDDIPEPADLTSDNATPAPPPAEETFVAKTQDQPPSATPSKEVFAERQRQITKNLAEFKTKLNLPGRIADLENEPAYKRRNISIDDTPHSSDSQVSRMRLNEETDEHGERRLELAIGNDNPFCTTMWTGWPTLQPKFPRASRMPCAPKTPSAWLHGETSRPR